MKKTISILAFSLLAAMSLSGCNAKTAAQGKAVEFCRGTWEGTVFTNPWLDVKFTFPEDVLISTEEEIKSVLEAGGEAVVEGGTYSKEQMKLSEMMTVYDFMVSKPDMSMSAQLVYENLTLSTMGKGMSEEDYINTVKTQLVETYESIGIDSKIGNMEEIEIAGKTFKKLPISLMENTMTQEYYCFAKDKRMVVMIISYGGEDGKAEVDKLISGITTMD